MGQLNRMTVTEANHEFTKLLSNVDANDIVILTKQNKDKYAVISKKIFDDIKEEIMEGFVITDDFMDTVNKYGTFKDDRDRTCKVWIENGSAKIIKISENDDKTISGFSLYTVPAECISIKKDDKIVVTVHNSSDIRMEAYDAECISEDDYEAFAKLRMAMRILENIGKRKVPAGIVTGCKIVER